MAETQPHESRPDTTIIDRFDIVTVDLLRVRVLSLLVKRAMSLGPVFVNQGGS
jgi:hypothetical protein